MTIDESVLLVQRCRAGDEQAEAELFARYLTRLLALVRSRVSSKLARRIDAEDVVQSAYHSFFNGLTDDRFVVERSGDLWRLLSAIAMHKLKHQAERHRAKKRSTDAEQSFGPNDSLHGLAPEMIARDPSPSEVMAVVEEVEHVMNGLNTLQREMLILRLHGHTMEEIGNMTSRSERTVRRLFDKLSKDLEGRLIKAGTGR